MKALICKAMIGISVFGIRAGKIEINPFNRFGSDIFFKIFGSAVKEFQISYVFLHCRFARHDKNVFAFFKCEHINIGLTLCKLAGKSAFSATYLEHNRVIIAEKSFCVDIFFLFYCGQNIAVIAYKRNNVIAFFNAFFKMFFLSHSHFSSLLSEFDYTTQQRIFQYFYKKVSSINANNLIENNKYVW